LSLSLSARLAVFNETTDPLAGLMQGGFL